jgi:hypothetical protein
MSKPLYDRAVLRNAKGEVIADVALDPLAGSVYQALRETEKAKARK